MRQLNFFLSCSRRSDHLARGPVQVLLLKPAPIAIGLFFYKKASIPVETLVLPLPLVTMGDMANEIKLLSGNSHPVLAKLVADR